MEESRTLVTPDELVDCLGLQDGKRSVLLDYLHAKEEYVGTLCKLNDINNAMLKNSIGIALSLCKHCESCHQIIDHLMSFVVTRMSESDRAQVLELMCQELTLEKNVSELKDDLRQILHFHEKNL